VDQRRRARCFYKKNGSSPIFFRFLSPLLQRSLSMTAGIDIRPAISQEDLEAVFRFRYKIYVEEMNRKQHYADHERRRIEDPLDAFAINLVAWQGDEVVGIVRINFPRDSDVGVYNDFYAMSTVGDDHPAHTSINTRLMIAPNFRKTRLALKMAIASYEYGTPKGIKWNFIDCNDHLVPFFRALGYVELLSTEKTPEEIC
jgi:hypothetical protein